jgi:PIN domain nuclease of toxin-antitoxin system
MPLLLDTQAALWFWLGDRRLGRSARALIAEAPEVLFSQVSTWEIQIKWGLGKLHLPAEPRVFLPEAVRNNGFGYLPISDEAIFFLGKLPAVHRDPFDRLLVAQAAAAGMTLISADPIFAGYPVKLMVATD